MNWLRSPAYWHRWWGHVGDGNYHIQVMVDADNEHELQASRDLVDKVNRVALKFDGTVTGEHGVGLGKRKYMVDEHGDAYALMGVLKQTMDPGNIMNPGKLVSVN